MDKVQELREYCHNRTCPTCELYLNNLCGDTIDFNACDEAKLTAMLECIYPTPIEDLPMEHDVIKHPNHYCRDGAMECIDEMVLLFGKEVVKHFCLCNIWKYRYRSSDKNGKQDIDKSDQYVRIYKELCNG